MVEGNGSPSNPFSSFDQALEKSRSIQGKEKVILIHGTGTLFLTKTIKLDERDSSLKITAKPGLIISGGTKVSGWKKGNNGLWIAQCPTILPPRELFINEKRMKRARFPNSGWLRIKKSLPDRRSGFYFHKNDFPNNPQIDESTELILLHDWSISRMPVERIDRNQSVLFSKFPIGCAAPHYAIDHFEKNPRYALEGSPVFIDQPGEWAYSEGHLYYMPFPEQKIVEANFIIPVLDQILEVKAGDNDKRVKKLRLEGITFSHCRFNVPIKGYASGQASIHEYRDGTGKTGRKMMPTAIRMENIENSQILNCKFINLGGAGLWLGRNSSNISVKSSVFENIGGNGINLGETDGRETAENLTISDCLIKMCGNQFFGCVGVWIGMAKNCKITKCEITNLPYTGISLGWKWDDSPTTCEGHEISHNHIHHVMQILSDGGGIYTLGRQPGTVLSHNHIHHIPLNAGRAQSNGIFMDQGSSAMIVRNNRIHDIAKSPIRFHKAKENTIQDNTLGIEKGENPFTFNATDSKIITFKDNRTLQNKELDE
jgi:hypothetical protein